jgi:hypothetical protein
LTIKMAEISWSDFDTIMDDLFAHDKGKKLNKLSPDMMKIIYDECYNYYKTHEG